MSATVGRQTLDRLVLWLVGLILLYSAIIFSAAYFSGADMGAWVWDRHQNQFSWYSRPLFMIPAAYYAYRRKVWHVAGFMALLATSLFWFDAPATVPPSVSEYLEWEKQLFFTNTSKLPLVTFIFGVFVFLGLFFYAFWQRNPWYGLALINVGTVLKIIVSVVFGQDAGMAAIVPSLSSLLVINLFSWLLWRRSRSDRS
ncbi:hypothetical protein [Phaeobacter sp. B1627]|uniref:hypothetical protein n=1 Tax=Phaeobacter sp. B1627 TaxID=2583809 RepID=UPI0011191C27|nr:hypothetical protein [Phaeobacter sp. B1627]TNJ38486.1 hypothetical protein FGE21_19645 [Phaeobacter sp. B1627]